jgi:tetratricopeptide (TPR) repeat protein
MSSAARTALAVVCVFAAVVLASVFYSRALRQPSVAASAPVATPAATTQTPLHPAYEAGLRALQDNRPAEARTSFESVPATDPSYLLARDGLAEALLHMGDAAGAIRELEAVARMQPDTVAIHEQLAWAYFAQQDPERAELAALRGLEIDPSQTQLRYAVGLFRIAEGRTVEALPAYKRAMEADVNRSHVTPALTRLVALSLERPDLPGVQYALAFFANAMQRPELERQGLEKFLAAEPSGALADKARARLELLPKP